MYGKGEVTSQRGVARGQAAKAASAEENVRARASASWKRGLAAKDAGDNHDDDGDEAEVAQEDEEEED